ncbi:MAG: 4a-hydroxytetrahydrobiopterin dehydratase [Sneathiellales bacterium]|nr:4a-hydroxytetrahydrobiopterin dehydratase [Sneathiellales bacterium]
MTKATEEQIIESLEDLPLWKKEGDSIFKELVAPNFAGAIGIVNAIAIIAEKADHHPDILLYAWNKIRVTLSTHDIGGLTNKDFKLAAEIDELKF